MVRRLRGRQQWEQQRGAFAGLGPLGPVQYTCAPARHSMSWQVLRRNRSWGCSEATARGCSGRLPSRGCRCQLQHLASGWVGWVAGGATSLGPSQLQPLATAG